MRFRNNIIIVVFLCLFVRVVSAATINDTESILSYDNLVLAEIHINRINTGETIELYQYNGGYLVPLGLVTDIIDFAIDVDVDRKTATGWFLSENRIFNLNVNREEVIIEGVRKNIDSRLIVVGYSDIYVDSTLLADWFGIDSALNFANLVFILKPREKLPVQLRLERDEVRSKASKRSRERVLYDIVQKPYEAYSMPFVDVELGYNYSSNNEDVLNSQTTHFL